MKKTIRILIVAGIALLGLLVMLRRGTREQEERSAASSVDQRSSLALSKHKEHKKPSARIEKGARLAEASQERRQGVIQEPVADSARQEKTPPKVDPETALKRWEDRLALYCDEGAEARAAKTPVTLEEQVEMRELFSALAPEAKNENINHAVNLLPDEAFAVLNGILFDLTQPPEVIAVVFNDLLNRDESIKNPVMEEIVKNKAHPMYVESARILDIVKE